MNRFREDLRYSLTLNEADAFHTFYSEFFPNFQRIETVSDKCLQRNGIDKIVHLLSGKKIFIDEKKRRVDYGDILIEVYSDKERKIPGWLSANKYTDYIAYAIIPANKLYFLPFQILRATMKRNYAQWKRKYGIKEAQNPGYITTNIAIPVNELLCEMMITMQQINFCK